MTTTQAVARTGRLSADERRQAIIAAAMSEVAARGLAGASTNEIARAAGVSQPYLFQLFGTKKRLFLEVVRQGFARTRLSFEDAAHNYEAGSPKLVADCNSILDAMGKAYMTLLSDRTLLLVQLQAYAACSDSEVQQVVRSEFAVLHRMVARVSGASTKEIHDFFAEGMLLNVAAAISIEGDPAAWSMDELGGVA
ncbi:MAG TPA: TetR/AcrR family transcriptional regulator [Candidatus Limnocylindrales bacterium]